MSPKSNRLILFFVAATFLLFAAALTLSALKENIVYFYTPSELSRSEMDGRSVRIGGLVKKNSIQINGMTTRFIIEDASGQQMVTYSGALPDIFRDGQGVIAEGKFENKTFRADVVMAKHDEKYMPREIADKLKEQGVWQGEESK